LFDRKNKETASGETTLHSRVTSPDYTMGGPRTRKKTGDAAKEMEKGKKEKNCNNEVDAQAKKSKKVTQPTEKRGKGSSDGKKVSSPAKSVTSDTESESERRAAAMRRMRYIMARRKMMMARRRMMDLSTVRKKRPPNLRRRLL
jgi:hypothetical protein